MSAEKLAGTTFVNDPFPEHWYKDNFRAMGSEMAVWLETADSDIADTALAQIETLFETNEQALSRFRPDSELSQLNARSGRWVAVSDLLWDVLALALKMAAATDGRYDPTMLNALEQYGYTVSFEELAWNDQNSLPRSQSMPLFPGMWTAVALDEVERAVFLPAGVRIDLGGIAKGYTAQQAVDLLRVLGPCLVDAGGDLVAGAAPQDYPGWPVAISSPWTDNGTESADMFTLWLSHEALATSGIDYRNWQRNGQTVHHLIDPATGMPAMTDGLTTTVLADDAVQAEAWATATLVAGSEQGMAALFDAGLAGLMVTKFGSVIVTPPMHQRLQMVESNLLPAKETR